jgi:hypothetical protein
MFILLFLALCVKLDPGTHRGNTFGFGLKTGCDNQDQIHLAASFFLCQPVYFP